MRKLIYFALLFFICGKSFAKTGDSLQIKSFSLSYFSNFLIQPGLRAAVNLPLKSWTSLKNPNKLSHIELSPSVGTFTRINDNANLLLGIDMGYKRSKKYKKTYRIYGLGLNYLYQRQLLSYSVNLGSSTKNNYEYENRHFILPTISIAQGGYLNAKWGWFIKLSAGNRFSSKHEIEFMLLPDFGLKYYFIKNQG